MQSASLPAGEGLPHRTRDRGFWISAARCASWSCWPSACSASTLCFLWVSPSELFEAYLRLIAGTTAGVLQVFGDDARVTGTSIFSSRFSLNIERGCDAIQVSAFFVFAVLAWPASVSRWRRATGVALGTLVLLTLNLVRIVSLYYTGIYLPGAFDRLHLDVWQPGFVVLALLFWMIWVQWVTRTETARPDVSV